MVELDAKKNIERIQAEKDKRLESEVQEYVPTPETCNIGKQGTTAEVIAEMESFLAELKRKHAVTTPTVIGDE